MSVEAWKCVDSECKGHIVFENADFDLQNPETINGYYAYDNPKCTECGKEYLVVPHYTVVTGDGELEAESTCITKYEKRKQELVGYY